MIKQRHLTRAALAIALLATTTATNLHSQVTIGSGAVPNKGALLDLKEGADGKSNKGLGLPRVKLLALTTADTDLKVTISGATGNPWDKTQHIGLVVYNTANRETDNTVETCPGLHVWDGDAWQPALVYPAIKERKVLDITKSVRRSFQYLDPANATNWPANKEADRAAGNYVLGNSKTTPVTDYEGNSYNTSRFYVGYKVVTGTYKTQRSVKCDAASVDNWKDFGTSTTETVKTFEDGVWMTENLRSEKMPDGTAITRSAASTTKTPYYHYPNLQAANKQYGLLYNWYAAMNMPKNGDPGNVNQGGSTEYDAHLQGICPDGWYLPSDQEYTDLENGIILNTITFSTTANIGTQIDYDITGWRGTAHGTAMKTTVSLDTDPKGTSKPSAQGGFEGYLVGYAKSGSAQVYGSYVYYWSSSSGPGSSSAWYRNLIYYGTGVYRSNPSREYLFSVRCKRR